MIVSQAEMDRVLRHGPLAARTVRLPVRYGRFGERKRCPAHPGRVCEMRAAVPLVDYRRKTQQEPSRARAVLRFIDLCDRPRKTIQVTVLEVEREGDVYVVSFVRGDQTDPLRIPAARPGAPHGDYVATPARALTGVGAEVSENLQKRYGELAEERRGKGGDWDAIRHRLLGAVQMLRVEAARQNAGSQVARRRLKTIENQLKALEREARPCA